MPQSADSGPTTLPREDVVEREVAASAQDYEVMSLVGEAILPPQVVPLDVVGQTLKPAEVAQARLFEAALWAEIATLQQVARYQARGSMGPHERDPDASWPAEELVLTRARIQEAHRLLDRLKIRFLRPSGSDDPCDGAYALGWEFADLADACEGGGRLMSVACQRSPQPR